MMCGIFGTFSTFDASSVMDQLMRGAQRSLEHRGPDANNIATFDISKFTETKNAKLSIGHTRLSIIDLSDHASQPMQSTDGFKTIVFNGEIYNYKELRTELELRGKSFRTQSDTEVLLSAWEVWGTGCLSMLKGMFAFALFDEKEGKLFLARDAFGIKPLFYSYQNEKLCFASEIPALGILLDSDLKLDLQSTYDYLVFGKYDSSQKTFLRNIENLLPGHLIEFDFSNPKELRQVRWWWPSIRERSDISFNDAAKKLRSLFLDSVRIHLRSDVPIGAALSGGIDSSAVVCAIRHLEPNLPIHTFSYVAGDAVINEEKWIDIVNSSVRAIPHKVTIQASDLKYDLDDLINAQGEPFSSTSIYAQYKVFEAARKAGIVVMLDGQGADELLAGYEGYPEACFLSLVEKREWVNLGKFFQNWAAWPGRSKLRAFLKLCAALTPEYLKGNARRLLGEQPKPDWLNAQVFADHDIQIKYLGDNTLTEEGRGRRLSEKLRNTLSGSGLQMLLRHADRNSMHWSIESRVPFLTTEIAEFLLALPERYLVSDKGATKHLFRTAMRGIVPDKILDRTDKIGFETPEEAWLLSTGSSFEKLYEAKADFGILNSGFVPFCLKKVSARKGYSKYTTWRLVNFSRWSNMNRVQID